MSELRRPSGLVGADPSIPSAEVTNALKYVLYALVGALVATGVQLGIVLSGTDPIVWRPLAALFVSSFFGSLATAAGTLFLPRAGSTTLASQVNTLQERGVQKRDMVVLSEQEAVDAVAKTNVGGQT